MTASSKYEFEEAVVRGEPAVSAGEVPAAAHDGDGHLLPRCDPLQCEGAQAAQPDDHPHRAEQLDGYRDEHRPPQGARRAATEAVQHPADSERDDHRCEEA